jgi:hypothetical protein
MRLLPVEPTPALDPIAIISLPVVPINVFAPIPIRFDVPLKFSRTPLIPERLVICWLFIYSWAFGGANHHPLRLAIIGNGAQYAIPASEDIVRY